LRKTLAFLLVLATTLLAGCGLADKVAEKAVEKSLEKATGVTVDEKGNSVTVKGQDGQSLTITTEPTESGKVPDGFPLPVFPGGKVTVGQKMTLNNKAVYTVEIKFAGEAKPATDFYEKALKERGFGDVSRMENADETEATSMLTGETDKLVAFLGVSVMVKTKEGTISISVSEK